MLLKKKTESCSKDVEDLDDIYNQLDRQDSGFTQEYELMIIPVDIKPPKKVEKIWGYELWIHNDEDYCGKLLVFPKEGSHFS